MRVVCAPSPGASVGGCHVLFFGTPIDSPVADPVAAPFCAPAAVPITTHPALNPTAS